MLHKIQTLLLTTLAVSAIVSWIAFAIQFELLEKTSFITGFTSWILFLILLVRDYIVGNRE